MYVDAMTLAAVADEWGVLLAGARIDTIIQPTEYALALQCYVPARQEQGGQNRWLYLSAHPQMARAHVTALKPQKIASEPPPFVMLLRKHLEGARIEAIEQPRWERVLQIIAGYRNGPEGSEHVRFRLIVEVMGRLSNIILCDEAGMILGSLKRIGADVNRYRIIAAGVPYVPPPVQQRNLAGQMLPRLEPTSVTAAQLSIIYAAERAGGEDFPERKKGKRGAEQAKLWQLLTRHLMGFSPLLAREIVYRTTEDSETPLEKVDDAVWEELAWNIRDLTAAFDTHRWQPQLVERLHVESEKGKGVNTAPIAFAPYVLEQYAHVPDVRIRQSPSINVLLDDYYARTEWRDAMEGVRAPIRKVLQTQRDRSKRKAELLQHEMEASEEAARYRLQGELLLAHQHEIQQGLSSVVLQNFFTGDENEMVTVPLDPRFDAVGNSNRMFNKYHKLRRALELVPAQIEQNNVELATIEQLLADLALAETPAEVGLVKAEVQSAGYIRGKVEGKKALKGMKKGKGGKQAKGKAVPPGGGVPLHVQSDDGFTILVGKNSRQNEDVTFHQASTNDIWLHARGVPGAHVIIKAAGREIPRRTLEQAARLAAYYSQARGSTSVPVDHTLQRHVRHMKGGGPGMVIYERERTIYAEPDRAQ
ncbi:MAG: NFACT family protein [Ktedonobacteraceae bacterium]|nr:NFACT family protein [Ktedonobacteraceae bacterium]